MTQEESHHIHQERRIARQERRITHQQNEINNLKKKLQKERDKNKGFENLEGTINHLNRIRKDLNTENQRLKRTISGLQDQIDDLEAYRRKRIPTDIELKSLRQDKINLKREITQLNMEIKELKGED